MHSLNAMFLVVVTAAASLMASTAATAAQDSPFLAVWETTALMQIEFAADAPFPTRDVYHVEKSSSMYFHDLLVNDESSLRFLDDPARDIVDVTVNVRQQTQSADPANKMVTLDSQVTVLHVDDPASNSISDLAALLTFLVNKNNTDASYVYLDNRIGIGATANEIGFISFSYVGPSNIVNNLTLPESYQAELSSSGRSNSEKTLVIVTTFLSLALVVISVVLVWVGGGWLELRKQVQILIRREEELTRMTMQQQQLESKPTDKTEEEHGGEDSPARETQFTNASGFLGANNPYHTSSRALQGLGIKMTPGRDRHGNVDDDADDLATPMSTYSDSGRAPIGIMSMRKLMPGANALGGNAGSDDSGTDDDEDPNSLPLEMMKQLEF